MRLLEIEFWPLWCAIGLMTVAAAVNTRTLMIPNRLSLPALLVGWLAALLVGSSAGLPSQGGGLLSSLAAAAVGFSLLLPFYAAGYLGAGCLKMQAAFGAWVGCALPAARAATLVGAGTLAGGLLTAAAGAMVWALARRSGEELRSRLFPAQITLSLGSVAGVVVPILAGWV